MATETSPTKSNVAAQSTLVSILSHTRRYSSSSTPPPPASLPTVTMTIPPPPPPSTSTDPASSAPTAPSAPIPHIPNLHIPNLSTFITIPSLAPLTPLAPIPIQPRQQASPTTTLSPPPGCVPDEAIESETFYCTVYLSDKGYPVVTGFPVTRTSTTVQATTVQATTMTTVTTAATPPPGCYSDEDWETESFYCTVYLTDKGYPVITGFPVASSSVGRSTGGA
ncbi:hypothetical protein EJ04DRAFT_564364 [Polyplosphaeria fusca]|uniref:Uncharacterized protein n=1 Tax=Polyplosphaeria fusca TaxID=682080 RepID=A0A9P4QZM8_9PLEO|nr:hypothetical protein EJ04DRAFT_564364 [Polyplosphaeria fusca]